MEPHDTPSHLCTEASILGFAGIGLILIPLVALACGSGAEGAPASNTETVVSYEKFITLEKGVESEYKSESFLVFKNLESWQAHYALTRGGDFNKSNSPSVDFSKENVVALHLGPKTRGTSVEILSVTFDSSDVTIQVRYKEVVTTSQITQNSFVVPYHMARVSKTSLSYRFINIGSETL